jgi:hypothetical protein
MPMGGDFFPVTQESKNTNWTLDSDAEPVYWVAGKPDLLPSASIPLLPKSYHSFFGMLMTIFENQKGP